MNKQKKLKAFSFFHLNLAYSAISVERRKEVIEKCYWPLLKLARSRNLPFGIEASAWTLETIAEIDPLWLEELRDLVVNGPCEFIGCGYAQVIGPLVPGIVNQANLRIGMQRYQEMLGVRPKIALINEQAFSAGLVQIYRDAGYEALIMEWNNPARAHPEWPAEWRYLPQYVCGTGGAELPIIWNESISFQKVQRYVHGEMDLSDWQKYFESHKSEKLRAFPVYGNDVEVFDFRPGRYMTEAAIEESEWQKLDDLYAALASAKGIEMVLPSDVLQLLAEPGAGNKIELGTAAFPVPVKKQDKYNLLRWAVTGRDDLGINTSCWRICEAMQHKVATEEDWQELCYLWSSDFRTHITESRWNEYLIRLVDFEKKWSGKNSSNKFINKNNEVVGKKFKTSFDLIKSEKFIDVISGRYKLRLNCNKGLAIEYFVDLSISELPLIGTIHHGYFDNIGWAADFYSGHLVYHAPGKAKLTDLAKVEPNIIKTESGVDIIAEINSPIGLIYKKWSIDGQKGEVSLSYKFSNAHCDLGSLRVGYITLNPEAFSKNDQSFSTHNGGLDLENYRIDKVDFDHGRAVSFLVSANQGFGVTEGIVVLGDNEKQINICLDKTKCATVGLLESRTIDRKRFTRIAFSALEMDDTSKPGKDGCLEFEMKFFVARKN